MEGRKGRSDRRFLTFQIGGGRYGISLDWVCAVQESAAEEGKLHFRGCELPLVNLAAWFGTATAKARLPSLLLIGKGEAEVALRVDSLGAVMSGERIRSWPALCGELVEGVFQGVIVEGESHILVVDPETICRAITAESDGSSRGGTRE